MTTVELGMPVEGPIADAIAHSVEAHGPKQTELQARWQPALLRTDGRPAFDIQFYVVALDGSYAGVTLHGTSHDSFAMADPDGNPRFEPLEAYFS